MHFDLVIVGASFAGLAAAKTAAARGLTVAVIEANLTTINQAVDDARAALAADPANGFLRGYLVNTRRRQLDLLRAGREPQQRPLLVG